MGVVFEEQAGESAALVQRDELDAVVFEERAGAAFELDWLLGSG